MSLKYLRSGFDFHGGGTDLIFPTMKMRSLSPRPSTEEAPFARYWLHSAFINMGNDKMSKSLGNVVTIREACEIHCQGGPFLDFRHPLPESTEFRGGRVESTARGLERLENARQNWRHLLTASGRAEQTGTVQTDQAAGEEGMRAAAAEKIKALAEEAEKRFVEAMEDDFNTALALGVLYELVRDVNKWCLAEGFVLMDMEKQALTAALSVLDRCGEVLGIWFDEPEEESGISDQEIAELIEERQKARAERNFQKADQIRDHLKEKGIVLEDTPQGVRWRRS